MITSDSRKPTVSEWRVPAPAVPVSRPWWVRLADWFYGYAKYKPASSAEKMFGVMLAVVIGIVGAALAVHFGSR